MKIFGVERFKDPDKHKYVQLIEFTLRNPVFVPDNACKACGLTTKEFQFISRSIYSLNAAQNEMIRPREEQDWVLLPEAYFSYLQFLEFKHAVKVANVSYWVSIAAAIVSIIGVAVALR
jgi:hypothetical protein